jgi:predicted permease
MGTFLRDLRYGIRILLKSAALTGTAILTLALGIGANTAIFSMVDSLLLRPLPVRDADRLVVLGLWQKNTKLDSQFSFSIAEFRDLMAAHLTPFSDLFGYRLSLDGISVNRSPERIMTAYVSGNFFSALGVSPTAGRLIEPAEGETPGADPVLVLGYSYWKRRFGGSPAVVGKHVAINGQPVTIIGVAPKGFFGVNPLIDLEGYLPIGMLSRLTEGNDFMTNRSHRNFAIWGHLNPHTSLAQARSALSLFASNLARQYPDAERDVLMEVFPELQARPNPDPHNRMMLISGLFLGLSTLVLALACVNVANLFLVRGSARAREMAIRVSLGATSHRLIRLLLTETVLLAMLGGVAGVFLGLWASGSMARIGIGLDLPIHLDFGFDWRIAAYAFLAASVTGIIVGIVPGLQAARSNLSAVLHKGGRGVSYDKHRLRNTLVIVQVAGSLTLLIVAGLFVRSLDRARTTWLGFDPHHVLNFSMDPSEIGYSAQQRHAFYKNLLSKVEALPGVESASLAASVPLGYDLRGGVLEIPGYERQVGQPPPSSMYNVVSTGYFRTMKISLVRGRLFDDADNNRSQYVAVISEAMAKRFWRGMNPLGREFKIANDPNHWVRIIGVTADIRSDTITGPATSYFFLPFEQHYAKEPHQTLQVRTRAGRATMIPEIQRTIQTLAPDLPVYDVKTMTEALRTFNGFLLFEVGASLAGALGTLGLILAIVGVYGVASYAAEQRKHEIGIRMALGAQPATVLVLLLRQGFQIVSAGVILGIGGALATGRIVGGLLTGVSPDDPLTYAAVSSVLMAVALTACYIPARRTMRTDPAMALRTE